MTNQPIDELSMTGQEISLMPESPTAMAEAGADSQAIVPGFDFSVMPALVDVAKYMALSRQGVPQPFRNQPGLCLAVAVQSHQWKMNPFGVAQCAYVVGDKVAYEAKVIKAALDASGVLIEPMDFRFEGEGDQLTCTAIGTFLNRLQEKTERILETPPLGSIHPKNSPLWKSDPKQQLRYYASRAWARAYAPAVLMGVYSTDEIAHTGSTIEHRPASSIAEDLSAAKQPPEQEEIQEEPQAEEKPKPKPKPKAKAKAKAKAKEEPKAEEPDQAAGEPEKPQESQAAPREDHASPARRAGIQAAQLILEALKSCKSTSAFDALLEGKALEGSISDIEAAGSDVLDRFNERIDALRAALEDQEKAEEKVEA